MAIREIKEEDIFVGTDGPRPDVRRVLTVEEDKALRDRLAEAPRPFTPEMWEAKARYKCFMAVQKPK